MTDKDHVAELIAVSSDAETLKAAQAAAAKKLLRATGIKYPRDGCAITVSCLLQAAGCENVPNVYGALDLSNKLKKRGWQVVPLGKQQPGDLGSTCGDRPHHGRDHIYVVLDVKNSDEMLIADNQRRAPHSRFVSGKGRTPTKFFLRAT